MSNPSSILLIDDDKNLARVTAYRLEKQGYTVVVANQGKEGVEQFKRGQGQFDLVLCDLQMPDINGIEVLSKIRKLNPTVPFIIITAYGSIDNAMEALKLGADDYVSKPFSQEQLVFTVEKALRVKFLEKENAQLRQQLTEKFDFGKMIARSPKMKAVLDMAFRAAQSDASVLILGESGTGKELLARGIHFNSLRKERPFVVVNCPAIPDNLLESELFGHVKGAYTGALSDRDGKFVQADGGTIFLDEIGDLRADVQAKLLRVLQEREVEPLGSNRVIPVNVRVIAATNQNLEELVKLGKFREDLYFRLNVVPLKIPPLRQRTEDIPDLVSFFIEKYAGGPGVKVSDDFLTGLQQYSWPGNVRELENLIERLLVLRKSHLLSKADLPDYFNNEQIADKSSLLPEGEDYSGSLADVERKAILAALRKCNGNKSRAAKMLSIPRHVLLYRLKKLGIDDI